MTQNPKCNRRQTRNLSRSDQSPGNLDQATIIPNQSSRIRQIVYWSAVAMVLALIISVKQVFASNIWDTFSSIMKDVYGKLLGISTIIAVTAATVALLVRMISRNQRAVDEATTWIKRIVITWFILNTLGFIIAYIQPLIQGGQYTP